MSIIAIVVVVVLGYIVLGSLSIAEVFTLCNTGPFGPGCPITRLFDILTFGGLGLHWKQARFT